MNPVALLGRILGMILGMILVTVGPRDAAAHALAPSLLSFELGEGGEVTMIWRAPRQRPMGQSLTPRIPGGCEAVSDRNVVLDEDESAATETVQLRCESPDLSGTTVSVGGFEDSQMNVVVRIVRHDGKVDHAILDADRPTLLVVAPDERARSFVEYLSLGVEHLLTGWDHLTFVLGLVVLFGWHRRLIAAITAFTIGHSLTLALSAFGLLSLPQAPVEALIALTLVGLALEIQLGGTGPVWRHPWILPGALGLLHGLGFASVLFDAGLPSDEIPWALLGFNLGIELGQLGVIALIAIIAWSLRPVVSVRLHENRTIVAYAIGSVAAFWVIERTLVSMLST